MVKKEQKEALIVLMRMELFKEKAEVEVLSEWREICS